MLHETENKLTRLSANADWVRVGVSLGRLANRWANRRDLLVYIGHDGGQGHAPAIFDPALSEIEINSNLVFGYEVEGNDVGDLEDPDELAYWAKAAGVGFHEAMHARFTNVDFPSAHARLGVPVWEMYQAMEEIRIEGFGIQVWPEMRGHLRAAARWLLDGTNDGEPSARLCSVLFLGRADVGVLDSADVAPLRSWLLGQDGWTSEILDSASRIWKEFATLDDSEFDQQEKMYGLAQELDRILPKDPASQDEEALEDLLDILSRSLSEVASSGYSEAADSAVAERAETEMAEAESRADEESKNQQTAREIFGDSGGYGAPASKVRIKREPTGEEIAAAVVLAEELERARYRDRDLSVVSSEYPPGKLRGGVAMRMSAARTLGLAVQGFEPFRRKEYQEHEDAHLTVGIMCDVSGSMGSVMEPMGAAVFVIGSAIYSMDGSTAAQVYFGAKAYPGLEPGQKPAKVVIMNASDGWENFDEGFRALDGTLGLIEGSGPRLLVVASDGQYGGAGQSEACTRHLAHCIENGVAVLWLGLRGDDRAQRIVEALGSGAHYLRVPDGDVTGLAGAIGGAMISAIEAV